MKTWVEDHVLEIIASIIIGLLVWGVLAHFRAERHEFENACHARGGHVKVLRAHKGHTYLCLSADDRLLDSKYI